jgi:FAD/FMN-containing dehydrogenase
VSVEITGGLPQPLDKLIREVLHRAFDHRPQRVMVHVSRPHGEVVVHVQQPFDRKLKFNNPQDTEIARELYGVLTEIMDEAFGPANSAT